MRLPIDDEDFSEDELKETPKRWTRFMREWSERRDFKFTVFDNPGYDQLIMLKDIDFASLCSHHLLPFVGHAHIGYLPHGKICGISKLARTVDMFASRPQVQERMTNQVADFLMEKLEPLGVMVVLEATHQCMTIRGVKKPNCVMITSAIRGKFRDNPSLKEEFLRLMSR